MVATLNLKDEVMDAIHDRYDEKFQYIAVGTDGTTPTTNDTALGSEVYRKARQEITRNDSSGQFIVSLWLASTEANGYTLQEAGVFDQASGGTMYARETFTALNKTNSIEVWIDFEFETTVSIE